ncbi:hypothetical protein [Leptospira meyeri]|uniref:hypothetical protein n=1 Tax=Leptospira meyeri TaxID=29508 RepID=UPI0010846189|nr:hypothetical protein [Leptospira meyeri]TGL16877.1 hypothetical protein EHQ50_00035 [Leptospira meyeri]
MNKVKNGDLFEIIGKCLPNCNKFIFVVRPELGIGELGKKFIEDLASKILEINTRNKWPGTELIGDEAIVYKAKFDSDSARIITKYSHDLFSWVQPNLPEDLCFLSEENETPFFISITHEKDAYYPEPRQNNNLE